MLLVLLALVIVVLFVPAPSTDAGTTSKDIMDYRQQLLAVILTAFGAWIGAGAAYYFGRENLAQATKSILEMRGLSPRERLRKETLRGLNPKPLVWRVDGKEDTVGKVIKQLEEKPELWFIPIIDEKKKLVTVVNDEAVFGYVSEQIRSKSQMKVEEAVKSIHEQDIESLLKWIRGKTDSGWRRRMIDIFVQAKMEESAGYVSDKMNEKEVYLTIITNDQGEPTHSLTTSDIRQALLRMP